MKASFLSLTLLVLISLNVPCERKSNRDPLTDTEKGTTWLKAQSTIPEPEVERGHPLAVGLTSKEHGPRSGVKAAQHPQGLGLEAASGHARFGWPADSFRVPYFLAALCLNR